MENFVKYFWEKIFIVVPVAFWSFTENQTNIFYGIVYIVLIDTILGIWVALKYQIFASHQLARVFGKISRYGLAMGSVWIISAVEPRVFGWLFHWTGLFIMATELFSNFEKLALLDFKITGRFLSKINKEFSLFFDETESTRSEIAENILKNRERCEK